MWYLIGVGVIIAGIVIEAIIDRHPYNPSRLERLNKEKVTAQAELEAAMHEVNLFLSGESLKKEIRKAIRSRR